MTINDDLKPKVLGSDPAFHYPSFYIKAPGTTQLSDYRNDPTWPKHLLNNSRLAAGAQFDLVSEAGLFYVRGRVEAVDAASGRIEWHELFAYEAPPVPASDLAAGGMVVVWRGGTDKWAVVVASPDPGVNPVVRSGFTSARLAAAELARLAGTKKRTVKAAA